MKPERTLSVFSLTTPEQKADIIMRRAQLARASKTYKQRAANTRYIRWLSVPRSPVELAKYPVPTTVAELRKIQEAFR